MKIFELECPRSGEPSDIPSIYQLKTQDPDIIFLMETKLLSQQLKRLHLCSSMAGVFVVDRVGLNGGLALLWKQSLNVSIKYLSPGHIDSVVIHPSKGPFRLTDFYGNPNPRLRQFSWQLLEKLNLICTLGWFIIGDSNEILQPTNKLGGRSHMEWQVDGFRKVLYDCFLGSIPYTVYKFTWNNKRSGTANVREYIDRCFANFEGQNLFPRGVVQHFPNSISDHQALCLLLDGSDQLHIRPGNRFHFESVWLGELECTNIIDEEWNSTLSGTITMHDVIHKVNNVLQI
nr:uncharacterized protein LOC125422647 [Ziziphus jujuba var. spinosa]